MNENEFKLINLGIKNRLNKKVKGLKKLYQALIDGDDVINFHSKCDNIPNTLVLINLQEIEDLVVLLLYHGLHQKMVNLKMILMHFYFLLINKEFILIKKKEMLFIMIKIMDLGLEMKIFR